MKEFYRKLFKNATSIILSVFVCALLLGGFAFAATTISANLSTTGTLDVTGLATFTTATSTSATTSVYAFVGVPFSNDANMDFSGGDLFVSGSMNVAGVSYIDGALQATSTSLFTGAATFYSTMTIAGVSVMNTTTATTTGSVWVGAPAGTATSTVIVGGGAAGDAVVNPGCLELWRENKPFKVYIDTVGTGLKVVAGRCKD